MLFARHGVLFACLIGATVLGAGLAEQGIGVLRRYACLVVPQQCVTYITPGASGREPPESRTRDGP